MQFMAANYGKTTRRDEILEDADGDQIKATHVPDNSLPLARVHSILDRMSADKDVIAPQAEDPKEDISDEEDGTQEHKRSEQVTQALKVTARLWSLSTASWPDITVDTRCTSL